MAADRRRVLPDEPDAGLNPALAHGAAVATRRLPRDGVALLSADLPALRPAELDAALAAGGRRYGAAFVADAARHRDHAAGRRARPAGARRGTAGPRPRRTGPPARSS